MRSINVLLTALLATAALTACDNNSAQELGAKIDDAASNIGSAA